MKSHSSTGITTGFCRLKELRSQEKHRYRDLSEAIAPECLAIAMLELDSKRKNTRAIKLLARVWNVADGERDSSIVRFNLHTIQNKPCLPVRASFRDGYLEEFLAPAQERALTERLGAPVVAAYFSQYRPDYVERELQDIVQSSPK